MSFDELPIALIIFVVIAAIAIYFVIRKHVLNGALYDSIYKSSKLDSEVVAKDGLDSTVFYIDKNNDALEIRFKFSAKNGESFIPVSSGFSIQKDQAVKLLPLIDALSL